MSDFVTVATVDEIPVGERIVVEFKRNWVVIFNVDGVLYAVEDQCSHEEYPLSDGYIVDCEIECAKHGARFDLRDGHVTAPPAFSPIKVFRVRIEDGNVQLSK